MKMDVAPKLGKAWAELKLDAKQGFVLSRVDGRTTVHDILLLMPFPESETLALLRGLVDAGAIFIEGETPSSATPSATGAGAGASELPVEIQRRIEEMERRLAVDDPFALLEIAVDADKRDVKRAYFKLSKEFHPDRYFGKKLGPWQRRLQEVFTALSAAFDRLSDDDRRAEVARDVGNRRNSGG